MAQLWCVVAQFVARRLAVRQARVRFSARHHRDGFPTELTKRWGDKIRDILVVANFVTPHIFDNDFSVGSEKPQPFPFPISSSLVLWF